MGCLKTLTMAPAVVDTDTPIHSAVYVPSTAKIIGTCENYLVRFDGVTGAFETSVKAMSPMYGQMHMVLINNLPWVGANADMSRFEEAMPLRDIFPVNTTTLALGAALGIDAFTHPSPFVGGWPVGPTEMVANGNMLFYFYQKNASVFSNRVDITNTAVRTINVTDNPSGYWPEHAATDGTYWYVPCVFTTRLRQKDMALANVDFCDFSSPYFPLAAAYATNVAKPFCVCGDTNLLQVDDFPTNGFTAFNLGAIQAGVKPMRIRYNSVDGLLYIPCQNQDGVIVWNPNTSSGTWKTGFPSVVDVVFTPTKKFAVMSSADGIKEIT